MQSVTKPFLLLAIGLLLGGGFAGEASAQDTLATPVWKLEPGSAPWLTTGHTERGGAYNPATDHILVVSRAGGLQVVALDAETGQEVGTLNVEGIAGGTFPLSEIAVTQDGQIFGANLTTNATNSPLKIYRWADETSAPELVFQGAAGGTRYGDGIGVGGSADMVTVYVSGSGTDNIAVFPWNGTTLGDPTLITPEAGVARARFGISVVAGQDSLWINQPGSALAKVSSTTGAIGRQVPTDTLSSGFGDVAYFEYEGRQYVATGPNAGVAQFAIVDVTVPGAEDVVAITDRIGEVANPNGSGFVAIDTRRTRLVVMGTNNGIASYALLDESAPDTLEAPTWSVQAGSNTWFAADHASRGGAYNPATDHVLVVSRTGGLKIVVLDPTSGDSLASLRTDGIAGGTFPLSEIAVTRDGQIFGANLTVNAASSPLKIYRWANEASKPELVYEGPANGTRYGDAVAVAGSGDAATVYVSGSGSNHLAAFAWNGSALAEPSFLTFEDNDDRGRYGIAAGSGNLWVNEPGAALALINSTSGAFEREVSGDVLSTDFGDLTYFELGGRQYIATGPAVAANRFAIVDVTTPGEEAVVAATRNLGETGNANATGFVAFDGKRNRLVVMATNNAIASYALAAMPEGLAPTASFVTQPEADAQIDLTGGPDSTLTVRWIEARDPEGAEVLYSWQLASSADFDHASIVYQVTFKSGTSLNAKFGDVASALTAAGVAEGQTVTLYQRVVTTDGMTDVTGPVTALQVTRGAITDREAGLELPTEFAVKGNYPNPFNPVTRVAFDLPQAAAVHVEVYDLLGRRVMAVPTQQFQAGAGHSVALDAGALSSGVYLYRVVAEMGSQTRTATGRMTLVK